MVINQITHLLYFIRFIIGYNQAFKPYRSPLQRGLPGVKGI